MAQLPAFDVMGLDGAVLRGFLVGDKIRLELDDLGGGKATIAFLSLPAGREVVRKLDERLGPGENGTSWECPVCSEEFVDRVPLTSRVRLEFRSHLVHAHHLHPDAAEVEYDRAVESVGGWRSLGTKRFGELVRHAADLVDDGHVEGSLMFELLDEIDRMRGRPRSSEGCAKARRWEEHRENRKKVKPPSAEFRERRAARKKAGGRS